MHSDDLPAVPLNDLKRHNQFLLQEIEVAIGGVLRNGWYILGPEVAAFEQEFATYCGTPHCVTTANGTDALQLALAACGIGTGDRVVTVPNAGGYGTSAILALGAEPLYVDVDPTSMLIAPDHVLRALDRGAKAIIATHLYGRMADMRSLAVMARTAGVPLIEDCAQAHGAEMDGVRAGAWGDAGCFSFYPTKNLGALGDGGAVVTRDDALVFQLRALRQYGWSEKYIVRTPRGRNSRMDEVQAAILRTKLHHLEYWNCRRTQIASQYTEAFRDIADVAAPAWSGREYVAHLYVLRVRDRDKFRSQLAQAGVTTDIHYPVPDHHQSAYRDEIWSNAGVPDAVRCAAEVVTLPCFPELSDDEVHRVISAVTQAVHN